MSAVLRALYHQTVITGTRTVYVSALNGNDSNNGTAPTQAYQTLQAASNNAQPGDQILVDAGIYTYVDFYGLVGDALHWFSLESLNDSVRPIIDVTNSFRYDGTSNDGIDVQFSTFVGIYGFEVHSSIYTVDTGPSGICVFRGSHHVMIWNNVVHDFAGGGINCFYVAATISQGYPLPAGGWDLVDASFNTIYNTSMFSPYNTSGISFYGAIDMTGTTWDGRYGYRAIGNYIWNVVCTAPYTPGGFTYPTDGNGISCDSLDVANNLAPGIPSYTKYGLLDGNLITGCGGRGVHIYNTINVDDFFGTYVGNLRTNSPAINGGVECDSSYTTTPGSPGITHYGCVLLPLNTTNTTDAVSTYTNCVILGGTQAVPSGNISHTTVGPAYFAGSPTIPIANSGVGTSTYLPIMRDAVTRQANSRGYQPLLSGFRAGASGASWAAGALEPASTPLVAL